MKHLILLLAFLPIVAEVLIDKGLWGKGRNDKPTSTILRYVIFAGLSVIFLIFGVLTWWQSLILLVFTHAAFFDLIINKSRGFSFFYHPDTNWWDRIWRKVPHWTLEVAARLWIFWVGFLLSFKWDLVQGNYITTGTYWEKFVQFFTF